MDDVDEPLRGPQLQSALANGLNVFGRRVRLNADAAGERLGVSASTVRRWVRNGVPVKRRADLVSLLAPTVQRLEQEDRELRFARDALWDISGRGAGLNPAWKRDGWLEPHMLTIVLLRDRGVLVPRITRDDSKDSSRRLRADGGVVIESIEFRNRFRAQVARGELLQAVAAWRVVIPAGGVSRGGPQAWLQEAPRPSLTWLRDNPQVKIPVTKPRRRKAPSAE